MNNYLGISTVCFEKNNETINVKLREAFSFFDVPLNQILFFDKKILSVQSLIDSRLCPDASLVGGMESFEVLCGYFEKLSMNLGRIGIESVILGSPFLRKSSVISKRELFGRINKIRNVFAGYNIKLYVEALPKEFSDVLNSHQELLDLYVDVPYGIHVDIATAISGQEGIVFFKNNIDQIDRFHFSVPGYGYNFDDYKLSIELLNLFISNKIKGTIEIQNFSLFDINVFIKKIHGYTNCK